MNDFLILFILLFNLLAYAKVLSVFIIDESAGLVSIEMSRANDEIGYIEGKETSAIKTPRISLWQHKGLADSPLGINMTEIGPCEQTVITTGTEYEPT